MTRPQLYLCQSLLKNGWSCELKDVFLPRCGASESDWGDLIARKIVAKEGPRFVLTKEGKRAYKEQRKTVWI